MRYAFVHLVRYWLICVVLASGMTSVQVACAGTLSVVAATGQAPSDGDGTLFGFGAPVVNDRGDVAFVSSLSASSQGAANDLALMTAIQGDVSVVAREGVTVVNGLTLTSLGLSVDISDSGVALGNGTLTGNLGAAFTTNGQVIRSVYFQGMPSPTGTGHLAGANSPSMNPQGDIVFWGGFNGPVVEGGIYRSIPDNGMAPLLQLHDTAPRGGDITFLSPSPSINSRSQVGVSVRIDVLGTTVTSVLRVDSDRTMELVRSGDVARDGTVIDNVGRITPINTRGEVALVGEPDDFTRPSGVYIASESEIIPVASNVLPGTTATGEFISLVGLSDHGDVAFRARHRISGRDRTGLYVADQNGVTLVAREGTLAPEFSNRYVSLINSGNNAINQDGDLAFIAGLAPSPTDFRSTESHLYLHHAESGETERIIGTGDPFMGDFIRGVDLAGSGQFTLVTNATGIGNGGHIAFVFTLQNGLNGVGLWTPNRTGDFDGDGAVDGSDAGVMFANWGRPSDTADVNDDGTVDAADAAIVFGNWTGDGTPFAVPEPCAWMMISATCCVAGVARHPLARSLVQLSRHSV